MALCAATRARAQASALAARVRVEPADDRCVNQAALRARIVKRLSRNAQRADVEIVVYVRDQPHIEVLRAGERVAERRFETLPQRCGARLDAMAVAVALALERSPERAEEPVAAPSGQAGADAANANRLAQPASVEATPSAAKPPPAPSAAQAQPREGAGTSPSALAVHAGAAALFEVLPAVAFAGVLGVELALQPGLHASLALLASLPRSDQRFGAVIESQLVLGRLLGCAELEAAWLVLEGCGGVLGGVVLAEGRGYAADDRTTIGYFALAVRGALRAPARGRFFARLALDGLVPLLKPSYAVREGATTGFASITVAPVGAALGLEVVLVLP